MRTAIYARISEDRKDGAGIERQLEDCRRKVEGPVEEFIDPSISAFSGKVRPAYTRLLDAVRRGEVDRIVVWKYDRLYRRPRELEDLIDLAQSGKVTIDAVMGGALDLSTSTGRTMARFWIAMTNQASEDTRDRVKRQKAQAKEQGKLLGGRTTFGWINTTTPNPAQVVLLNTAVDLLLSGASLNDISRRWNEQGVPTPQGRRDTKKTPVAPEGYKPFWTPQTVRTIVSNPRHAGKTIDSKKWQELQALLLRRSVYLHVPRRRSLLTGLVVCSLCGTKMVRTGAGIGRSAWRCPAPSTSKTGCGRVSIGAEGLENLLVDATLARADKGDLARTIKKMGTGGEQDQVMAELGKLNEREDEMSVAFGRGELPLSAFNKATTALAAERQALTSRLGRLTSASVISPYLGKPGLLRASWATLTIDQQREIIRMVLGKIEVAPTRKQGLPRFDPKRVKIA